jgi:hypothetical protein
MGIPAIGSDGARFVYLTGADGTGKSTHARLLIAHLARLGVRCHHVWLRYPFFLSAPLLAYARWRGYSWYETREGVRHGYWAFARSRLLRALLPWTLLIDAALAALRRVYLPLWLGYVVVCERFVLDMLVDLAVALEEPGLYARLPGCLYRRLIPHGSAVICLDLDASTIRARRPDLRFDRSLTAHIEAARRLALAHEIPLVSTVAFVEQVEAQIERLLGVFPGAGATGYAHLRLPLLRRLARSPLLTLAAHWAVQGLLYMDCTERRCKLALDLALALLVRFALDRALPPGLAWGVALVIAHTANMLLNGHLWGALKHYALVHHSWDAHARYVDGFVARAWREPAIDSLWICGSLSRDPWSRDAWSPASDLDVRLLRRAGLANGVRACWFLLRERTRALCWRFPLDAYVVDSREGLLARGIEPDDLALSHAFRVTLLGRAKLYGKDGM